MASTAKPTYGNVVVINPTGSAIKNVSYTLSNQVGSGSNVSIDAGSAGNCTVVAANSQCVFRINIPAGTVAGSFVVSTGDNISQLMEKLGKRLSHQTAKSITANLQQPVAGIVQAQYSTVVGADGISLNYYHTVLSGTPYVVVNGVVTSSQTGKFNNVVLVSSNNNPLPNQLQISGNLGAGLADLSQGDTFSILLPVPSGTNASQVIKVQISEMDATSALSNIQTATGSSTLLTVSDSGITNILPDAVYLTAANPSQIITFTNTGDIQAQLAALTAANPNIEVTFNPTTLGVGSYATATLTMKDTSVAGTTGAISLTYNNGQGNATIDIPVDENINPSPSPSPTPTPTPIPTPVPPPPPPFPGLTVQLNPDKEFFTTTVIGGVSREMTITNSGNTAESGFTFSLPVGFSIAGTGNEDSCTVSLNTLSDTLSKAHSCKVTVTYTNSTVTPQDSAVIAIDYNYNGATSAPIPVEVAVDYRVTQSTANLSISPDDALNYGSIANNNQDVSVTKVYTVTNSGEVDASDLAFNFSGAGSTLFNVLNNGTCMSGGTLGHASGSNSCTVNAAFGPIAYGTPVGSKSASFDVDYTPYTGGVTVTTSKDVSATVTQAPSATFGQSVIANTFLAGSGTQVSPYQGYTDESYTISVRYLNTSAIAAESFTTTYSNPPSGWTLTLHGCDDKAMPMMGQCTDIYTLNDSIVGATSINLANVTASWKDSSSGPHTDQAIPGSMVYANLSAPPIPNITITPLANWETVMGNAFAFTASIDYGTSTVTPNISGLTGNTVSSCSLDYNSGPESCVFIITAYTGSGNYSYWNPASIANSSDINNPESINTYNSISLSVTATNSATINGESSPQTFNSINGTIFAPYVYLPAPMTGTATESNTGITWGSGGTLSSRFALGSGSESGCITDNLTGLMWPKNGIIGFKAASSDTTPLVQPNYANTTANLNNMNWMNAQQAISNMNTAPTLLCEHDDWRLPTVNELSSLLNYAATQTGSTPAAWLNSQGVYNVQVNRYWSSTVFDSYSTLAWFVNFNNGGSVGLSVSNSYYVWPVRSGEQ